MVKVMKIRIELDERLEEEEIIIKCRELNEEIVALQKQISDNMNNGLQLNVFQGEVEYFLNLSEIIFFETDGSFVAVHTKKQIFSVKMRLYELEDILPGNFIRISKSAIVNVKKIRSIHKNITGASEIEFQETSKKAFVSRSYFKLLIEKLEEKRLKR